MRNRALIAGFVLLAAAFLGAGEVLDRLVATVNGHALLASDWEEELRYECFMAKRPLAALTPDERNRALDRLIDQELVGEQMHSAEFKAASPDEIDRQVEALRSGYGEGRGEESWSGALRSYGISEAAIRRHVELELNQARLIEARLRPAVEVDSAAVESYYREQLVPKIAPAEAPALAAAEPGIRELLIEKKVNDSLSSWLQTLRSQAQIRVLARESSSPPAEAQ
jgi:hypothetical protein